MCPLKFGSRDTDNDDHDLRYGLYRKCQRDLVDLWHVHTCRNDDCDRCKLLSDTLIPRVRDIAAKLEYVRDGISESND